jgi:hypothetical protein
MAYDICGRYIATVDFQSKSRFGMKLSVHCWQHLQNLHKNNNYRVIKITVACQASKANCRSQDSNLVPEGTLQCPNHQTITTVHILSRIILYICVYSSITLSYVSLMISRLFLWSVSTVPFKYQPCFCGILLYSKIILAFDCDVVAEEHKRLVSW